MDFSVRMDAPPCGGWTQARGTRDLEECNATSLQPGTASAYRSELVGIYGGLLFVKKLCDAENITSGAVRVGCDNLTAVNRCPGNLKVPTNAHHSDIL